VDREAVLILVNLNLPQSILVSNNEGLFCRFRYPTNSPNQTVQFTGGLENDTTQVSTPTGNFKLTGGATTGMMMRTKADVPIEVTCNGVTQKTVVPTHFGAWGLFGNILFGGIIGWIIDGTSDKAYDVQTPFNVGPFCKKNIDPTNIKN
jgi:hypothetical protein